MKFKEAFGRYTSWKKTDSEEANLIVFLAENDDDICDDSFIIIYDTVCQPRRGYLSKYLLSLILDIDDSTTETELIMSARKDFFVIEKISGSFSVRYLNGSDTDRNDFNIYHSTEEERKKAISLINRYKKAMHERERSEAEEVKKRERIIREETEAREAVEAEERRKLEAMKTFERAKRDARERAEAEERRKIEEAERAEREAREREAAFWASPEGQKVRAAQMMADIERERAIEAANIRIAEQQRIAEIGRQIREEERQSQAELIRQVKDL